jgi:tetratricopeptide (TPR) repeat protein
MVWGMAWEGFTERPLLGWGQENFIDVFTKHYNPRLFDQEPYFDRSHNIILDWLISAGILGFVAYLGLFAVTFIVLWRLLKGRRFGFLEFAVLSLTLTAYFIQNLFVFDNFSTYFLFFAILAYVQAATGFDGDVRGGAFQGKLEDKHALRAVIAGGVALVFMVPVAYTVNIKPIQESRSLINALRFISEKGALAGTLERFDKTFSYRTFGDREAAEQMNTIANQVAAAKGIPIEEQVHFLEETVTVLEKQAEVVSRNLKAHTALGSLYNLLSPVDSSYVAKANEHIMKAISISPTRQNSYFLLADNLVIQNDVDGALDALREAVALAPEFIIPQSNLAFVALAFDRTAITDEVYEELDGLVEGRKSDADAAALARIGSRYIERGDGERALRWYDLAIRANEGIPQHHAIIAELYLVQGDAEQAIFHAMRAAELDPKNFKEQIDAFLNQLGE